MITSSFSLEDIKSKRGLGQMIALLSGVGLITGGLWYLSRDFKGDIVEGLILSSMPLVVIGVRYIQYPSLNIKLYNFANLIFLPLVSVAIDIVSKWIHTLIFPNSPPPSSTNFPKFNSDDEFQTPGKRLTEGLTSTLVQGVIQGLMYSGLIYYTNTYKLFFGDAASSTAITTAVWAAWFSLYNVIF